MLLRMFQEVIFAIDSPTGGPYEIRQENYSVGFRPVKKMTNHERKSSG